MAENMKYDFTIETLGACKVHSPIELSTRHGEFRANYVKDSTFVLNKINVFDDQDKSNGLDASNLMQKAGPREMIYFSPNVEICWCINKRR